MNENAVTTEERPDDSVGRTLKLAREERNVSIAEAARATKIKKDFLVAMEEERFELLPGDVFARGFVRSYAEFLGLDGKTIASRAVGRTPDGEIPSPARIEGADYGWLVRLLSLSLIALALAAVWYLQHKP